MRIAWAAVFFFIAAAARAGEADYFTNRYPLVNGKSLSARKNELSYLYSVDEFFKLKSKLPGTGVGTMQTLPDSLKPMNAQMNRELDLVAANSLNCRTSELHEVILARLGGFLIAKIEQWDHNNPDLKSYGPYSPLNEFGTVYSDTGVRGCCADIMKINNTLVSHDKLGHFISHGYEYFEVSQRKSGILSESFDSKMNKTSVPFAIGLNGNDGALELGHRQEDGAWGRLSSGVYSYGDLAANYDGMNFWKELTSGRNPYFVCRNGKWKRQREFDWSEYVSDAWDEAINCNVYGDSEVESKVAARIKQVQLSSGKTVLTCPVEPAKCGPLIDRYGSALKSLNPKCITAAQSLRRQPPQTIRNTDAPGRIAR